MLLGALLDTGLPLDWLCSQLKKIPLGAYEVEVRSVLRSGLAGTQLTFRIPAEQPHRHLHQIVEMLEASALPESVRGRARRIFNRLAEAEGKLHAMPPAKVHFHEVGAVDAVLDIAGACLGLDRLGLEELVCSPLNLGGGGVGRVKAEHGSLPVPAPATAELLKGIPVYSSGVEEELVTPTGAAIVAELASSFGPIPPMKIARVGYGAGSKEIEGHPNLLRLLVGERVAGRTTVVQTQGVHSVAEDVVSVIEANLDDMSPQLFGYFEEKALALGALDVTSTAVQMKKNRPGIEIAVLCRPEDSDKIAEMFFLETTTIGIRIHEVRRLLLERELVTVETDYGPARVKVASRNGTVLNIAPEYDDCSKLAKEKSVPLKQVMLDAQMAYRQGR